jgi:FtsH-binding integral membrane protein
MSATNKLMGAGALVMALCCALAPLLGAALGGGLIAGAGPVGLVAGAVVLVVVMAVVLRRRRAGQRC